MILELFWPREVKELIAKYREEGTLNEEAVRLIKRTSRGYLILFAFISAIFIVTSEPVIGISILLLSPLFVRFDCNNLFKNQIATYCYGKTIKARVEKVGIGLYGTQRIVVSDLENKTDHVIKLSRSSISPNKELPSVGDIVEVNIDPNGQYGATLNISHLKQKHSLTTKIV